MTAPGSEAAVQEPAARKLSDQTISDFGDQWQRYTDNEGYYGSPDLLSDVLGPLLGRESFRGTSVAEIGSGTGRIVRMLLAAGASRVLAIEPSEAFDVLRGNVGAEEGVELLKARGEELPPTGDFDFVVSIGVVHHIPAPEPVIRAALGALRPGGRLVVWVYGREGNQGAVRWIEGLRRVTVRLPHGLLAAVAWACTLGLELYAPLCRVFRLPLHDYVVNVLGAFSLRKRYLVVYDQLKPAYSKYYSGNEARELLERAGFESIECYHRRGYSWTVVGTKPS